MPFIIKGRDCDGKTWFLDLHGMWQENRMRAAHLREREANAHMHRIRLRNLWIDRDCRKETEIERIDI